MQDLCTYGIWLWPRLRSFRLRGASPLPVSTIDECTRYCPDLNRLCLHEVDLSSALQVLPGVLPRHALSPLVIPAHSSQREHFQVASAYLHFRFAQLDAEHEPVHDWLCFTNQFHKLRRDFELDIRFNGFREIMKQRTAAAIEHHLSIVAFMRDTCA
ncbi:hypothetical protein OBBRIDRAFT_872240 [Obba rivulosa]|uniref:Uncharacterized protein n=1 Tax=Obba rivulosa TaxID=1052685 RepID=A0A8E2DFE2_9APHY|nr:hypothetical protein OBBRIDRAFT_872240 [Obba rivulosa]